LSGESDGENQNNSFGYGDDETAGDANRTDVLVALAWWDFRPTVSPEKEIHFHLDAKGDGMQSEVGTCE